MAKKKKKEPKVEKVFGEEKSAENEQDQEKVEAKENVDAADDFLGEEKPEDHLTEKQRKKLEKINAVKSKISKILQSSNIEIVDENFGDEYEFDSAGGGDGQSQQDYDSLKAMFGDKEKAKKQEITLTIDEFDYSYVGQYLEEYDLMHMKNIKKVKIQRKHSPKLRKFLIAAVLVVLVGVGAFLGYFFTRKAPVVLTSITLNQLTSEDRYYEEDIFDYTGLYLITEYSDGKTEKIKLTEDYFNSSESTKITLTGEDRNEIQFGSSGVANLVFSYGGFNVTYTVNVLRKRQEGIHALYSDAIFNVAQNEYITEDMLKVFIDYGGYGSEFIELSSLIKIKVDGVYCDDYNKNYGYKVKSTNGTWTIDETQYSAIVIEYGGKSVQLDPTLKYV